MRSILLAFAAVASVGSLGGLILADLLPCWWWSEALQHPRWQLAAGSAVGAGLIMALARHRWRWCLLAVPLWALLGMLPALAGGAPTEGTPAFRLVAANVHSANPDPDAAVAALLALDADVLVLLEPDHGWRGHLAPLRAAYPVQREVLRDDNFGVCAYARRGTIAVWQPDAAEVPSLLVTVDGIEVLATHPPPPIAADYHAWWSGQLTAIAAWSAARPRAVVAGDLNATPWSRGFSRLLADGRLAAAGGWSAWSPTWMRRTVFAAPIDHLLVGRALGVQGFVVGADIGSDHRPVMATILVRP